MTRKVVLFGNSYDNRNNCHGRWSTYDCDLGKGTDIEVINFIEERDINVRFFNRNNDLYNRFKKYCKERGWIDFDIVNRDIDVYVYVFDSLYLCELEEGKQYIIFYNEEKDMEELCDGSRFIYL